MLIARKLNLWMHCKASREHHIFWMEMQCKSLERRLARDGQKGCCYSQGCRSLDQRADIQVFAIILTEVRKKGYMPETSQNLKIPFIHNE
jgi:predicted DNA-binding WGR domain protein